MLKKLSLLLLIPITARAMNPEKVYENTKSKVVKIGMVDAKGRHGNCSGAYINSSGDVLTCAHCFSHPNIVKVFVKDDSEKLFIGVVEKLDIVKDLALVHLLGSYTELPWVIEGKNPDNFPYFRLGKSIKRGQEVLLFGSPLSIQHNLAVGYIENFLKKGDLEPHRVVINSAGINPGNSGGPLVDLHGRLVGIGEGSIMENPFVPAEGLGFAVDLDTIKVFLGDK